MPNIRLFWVASFLSLLLTACGGGSTLESEGNTTTGSNGSSITLSLSSSIDDGSSVKTTSKGAPITATAVVRKAGKLMSNQLVTFTLSNDVGVLSPASAVTDENGNASVQINPSSVNGAGGITAAVTVEGETLTSNVYGFSSETLQITLSSSGGEVSKDSPVTISASVIDSTGSPREGVLVEFVLGDGDDNLVRLGVGNATLVTNSTGGASITLLASTVSGAGSISAKIASSEVSSSAVSFSSKGDGIENTNSLVADVILYTCDSTWSGTGANVSGCQPTRQVLGGESSQLIVKLEQNGQPVINKLVTVGTNGGNLSGEGLGEKSTDVNGYAIFTLSANSAQVTETIFNESLIVNVDDITLSNFPIDIRPSAIQFSVASIFRCASDWTSGLTGCTPTTNILVGDDATYIVAAQTQTTRTSEVVSGLSIAALTSLTGTGTMRDVTDSDGFAYIKLTGTPTEGGTIEVSNESFTLTSAVSLSYTVTLGANTGGSLSEIALTNNSILTNQITATTTLTDGSGTAISGAVVRFALDDASTELATFAVSNQSAVTNSSGTATIQLFGTAETGAVLLEATYSVDGVELDKKLVSFTAQGSSATKPSLILTSSDSGTVLDANANQTIDVNATLTDQNGNGLTDRLITFSLAAGDENVANLSVENGAVKTSSGGVATVTLTDGTQSGAGALNATYIDTSVTPNQTYTGQFIFTSEGNGSVVSETGVEIDLTLTGTQLSSPITATAILSGKDKDEFEGKSVQFTLDNNVIATFDISNGLTVIDGNAEATIILSPCEIAGGGLLTATFTDEGSSIQDTAAFNSLGGASCEVKGVSSVYLISDVTHVPTGGTDVATLTAVVRDSNNNLVEGAKVAFQAPSGELKVNNNGITDTNGRVTATLSAGSLRSNRDITVTATSEAVPATHLIKASGTQISISASDNIVINDTASLDITLVDSNGVGISDTLVTITSNNNNTISGGMTTDSNGKVFVTLNAINAGSDELEATALGSSDEFTTNVSSDSFDFNALATDTFDVNAATADTISVTWSRNNVAVVGEEVLFTATRGTISPNTGIVTTDANGVATVTITSTDAGKSKITAKGMDDSDPANVQEISTVEEVEFIAKTAGHILLKSDQTVVAPNGNTATLTAIVRDSSVGNFVKGVDVVFSLTDFGNGTLSSNKAVTNERGEASVIFTSNGASNLSKVIINATVEDNTAVNTNKELTVTSGAISIKMGTANIIEEDDEKLQYVKHFVVNVDSNVLGPVEGAIINVSAKATRYFKGTWVQARDPVTNAFTNWSSSTSATCNTEDSNGNELLDASEDTNGDDYLSPGNFITYKTLSDTTDDDGNIIVEVRYAQEYAHWIEYELEVSTAVNGTEAFHRRNYTLGISLADAINEELEPENSPWGESNSCTDIL